MKKRYIDIHTHILPGVDDGATSLEDTKKLLEAQIQEGVTRIIATPHFDIEENFQDIETLQEKVREVQEIASSLSSDLTIYLGCEILYSRSVLELLKDDKIPTIAGTDYILVEFYPSEEYNDLYQAVRDIIMLGKTPIIAHIERYECVVGKEKYIRELINQGAYIQVNTRSLLGGRFDKRTRFCKNLVKKHLVHFLGSDCHNMEHRPPKMQDAVEVIKKIAGEDIAEELAQKNGDSLLAGEYI